MLRKLLKHDLMWSYKLVIIYHLLGLIIASLARLSELLPDTTFFIIITKILQGVALSCFIPGLINSIIRSWVRLINNMYKDEAYLTHTIPVDIRTHYLSKVLSGIILVGVSTIFLLLGIIIMYFKENTITVIKEYLNIISQTMNLSMGWVILLLAAVVVLEIILITLEGYFGIIYGYSFNNYKLLKSFIYGICFGLGCNVITIIVIMFAGLFDSRLYDTIFTVNANVEYSVIFLVIGISIVLYTSYIILAYILSNNKLKKGINID